MSHRIDTTLLPEIETYGAADIDACFNCGNCTAVCPLADNDANFPRRLIRYAQLGMRDRLLASKDVWMCYYCGACSSTCPREAEPGEFMAAARRYAVANYDITGLARMMYRSPVANVLITLALVLFFGALTVAFNRPAPLDHLVLFTFIPEIDIKITGLTVFGIIGIIGIIGLVRMVRSILDEGGLAFTPGQHQKLNWVSALRTTLVNEVIGQTRYRDDDCEEEVNTPLPLRKWFVHATILYGFVGLFGATAFDYLFKPLGSFVPLTYPPRLLGTAAGLALMYGTTVAIIRRLQRRDKAYMHSQSSDWTFLVLLWLTGLTGFVLEMSVYTLIAPMWGYELLRFHVVLALTLLALMPVGKFAHVIYRTVALFLYNLRPVEETEERVVPAAAEV